MTKQPWEGGEAPTGAGGVGGGCSRRLRSPPHTHLVPAQPLPHRLVELRVAGAAGDEDVGVDVPGGSALAHVGGRGVETRDNDDGGGGGFASSLRDSRRGTAHRLREGKSERRRGGPVPQQRGWAPGAPRRGRCLPQLNAE